MGENLSYKRREAPPKKGYVCILVIHPRNVSSCGLRDICSVHFSFA